MITVEFSRGPDLTSYEISPITINIPQGSLNENLQHVAQSCQLSAAYEPELLQILATMGEIPATVKDDGIPLFIGTIDTAATWTDNGLPTPIDQIQVTIHDFTKKLDTQVQAEIALIDTTVAQAAQKICTDCHITIDNPSEISTHALQAFVLDPQTNYLQALNDLLFQYQQAFIFTAEGHLKVISFDSPPPQIERIDDSVLLTGFTPTRTPKKYGAIKIGYTPISTRTAEQVYHESRGLDATGSLVPFTLQPNQYFPYDSAPVQEDQEGQVYQEFAEGYAQTTQGYNGEVKYNRSQKTSLLYTKNHQVVKNWRGSIIISRAQWGARRASVRLLNKGTSDAQLNEFSIRADAWYKEAVCYVTSGSGTEYLYEGEFLYTAQAAEALAKTLSKYFRTPQYRIKGRLLEKVTVGNFYSIDTGITGFTTNVFCISCSFEPESEVYTAEFVSYGGAAVDTSRTKNSSSSGNQVATIIGSLYQKVNDITARYTIDVTPDSVFIPVNENGEPYITGEVEFQFVMYKGSTEITTASWRAFIGRTKLPITGNSFTVDTSLLTSDVTEITLYGTIEGEEIAKIVTISKLYGASSPKIYKLIVEPSKIKDQNGVIPPINAMKRVVDNLGERDTEYGIITISMDGGEEQTYGWIPADETFNTDIQYGIKLEPIMLSVGNEDVLAAEADVAAVFYRRIK